MDPVTAVSLASSITDLAELTFNVFANLYKYYRNIRDAPARSAELRQELDILLDILGTAQEYVERHPGELFGPTLIEELSSLRQLLSDLERRTRPQSTAGFRRLQWPFHASENDHILSRIQRHKSNLMFRFDLHQSYRSLDPCFV